MTETGTLTTRTAELRRHTSLDGGRGSKQQTVVAVARPPKVLVLMATFNGARWITGQLRSILSQEDVRWTLVVRDDASTDDTLAVLRKVCGRRANVIVHRAQTWGGSASANFFALMQVADASGHDYVALSDQDDQWNPRKLARAVDCLRKSGASGYSASVEAVWPDGRTAVLRQKAASNAADHLFEGAGQGCSFVMSNAFFRRVQASLVANRASFASLHYHDWALYALCREFGEQWFFDDWVSLQYRQHEGNDTGARRGVRAIRKRLGLIRSGWYQTQIDGIARLCLSVATDAAPAAEARHYLALQKAARDGLRGKLAFGVFVLRAGRRKLSDRMIVAWAASRGYLNR